MSASLPLDTLWALLLASVRVTALFGAAPVLSHRAVPLRVRGALALVVTWAIAPELSPAELPQAGPVAALALGREALVGFTLGFALRLVFAGFGLLGEFIAVQGGLGAATVLDPTSGTSSVVLTSLLQFYALAVFLAIEGHHAILRAAARSFALLPPGAGGLAADVWGSVGSLGGALYDVAARLAAPVTAVMLVSNVAVGILGRVIPQLNLMALQLPAHIGVTLLVLSLGTNAFAGAVADTLTALTDGAIAAVRGES